MQVLVKLLQSFSCQCVFDNPLQFLDSQVKSIYLLSPPSKNTSSRACEPPHESHEALLKQIKAAFDMSSTFGNDKATSLDFEILMKFFVVIMSLTVTSLIELLTTLAACVTSGQV